MIVGYKHMFKNELKRKAKQIALYAALEIKSFRFKKNITPAINNNMQYKVRLAAFSNTTTVSDKATNMKNSTIKIILMPFCFFDASLSANQLAVMIAKCLKTI